jgi:hypothetical protein
MEDGLSRAGPDIQHGAVAILDVAVTGYLGGRELASSYALGVFGRSLFQSNNMFLRNDQHVRGSLRIQIFESECVIVFEDLLTGNFAANNLAEDAGGH